MTKLTDLEEAALQVLDVLHGRRAKYDAINTQIHKLMGDFPTLLQDVDTEIHSAVMKLVTAVLGNDDIASYYLHECVGTFGHGGGIECCPASRKKPWKLRNTGDLRKYLLHARKCPGLPSDPAAATSSIVLPEGFGTH